MANQHTGNFEHVVKDRFKCSAREMLLKCKTEGLSYQDAEKVLGFKHVTIRKWAKRFDIKLPARFVATDNRDVANQGVEYIKCCKSKKTDRTNIFSRCWVNMSLYSTIKAKS
jgi:transposase